MSTNNIVPDGNSYLFIYYETFKKVRQLLIHSVDKFSSNTTIQKIILKLVNNLLHVLKTERVRFYGDCAIDICLRLKWCSALYH